MLSHKNRFHGRRSLGFVFRSGVSVRSPHFLLRVHRASNRTESRAAVVVSKKVSKRAVVRNRIRRRIYETVRLNWQEQLREPHDIAFTVMSPEVALMPQASLETELSDLMARGREVYIKKAPSQPPRYPKKH